MATTSKATRTAKNNRRVIKVQAKNGESIKEANAKLDTFVKAVADALIEVTKVQTTIKDLPLSDEVKDRINATFNKAELAVLKKANAVKKIHARTLKREEMEAKAIERKKTKKEKLQAQLKKLEAELEKVDN